MGWQGASMGMCSLCIPSNLCIQCALVLTTIRQALPRDIIGNGEVTERGAVTREGEVIEEEGGTEGCSIESVMRK